MRNAFATTYQNPRPSDSEARATLHGRFDNGTITGGASFVFEELRAGKRRIILTPSAFKFSNFSSVNYSILLNKKKNDSNKIKTSRQGQKEQNMH